MEKLGKKIKFKESKEKKSTGLLDINEIIKLK